VVTKKFLAVAICLIALSISAFADDFSGSKSLIGITDKIIEINPYKIIDDVNPDALGLPKRFLRATKQGNPCATVSGDGATCLLPDSYSST